MHRSLRRLSRLSCDCWGCCSQGMHAMGVPAGSSELEQPKAAINRELSSDRPPAPPAKRLLSMAELEQHLLKGYSNRPFTSDLSDLGQVLHGLVAACRRQLRDWGEHVGILQAGSEQHDGSLSLQMHASTLLCILHSPQHWSLLVLHRPRKGRTEACIYDGRVDKVCQDSAHAFLVSLQGRGWMPEESLSPVTATCSKQTDSWSCGHRLVLTADMVLSCSCFCTSKRIRIQGAVNVHPAAAEGGGRQGSRVLVLMYRESRHELSSIRFPTVWGLSHSYQSYSTPAPF